MTSSDVVIHLLKELKFIDVDDANDLFKMRPRRYPAFGRIERSNGIEIIIMPDNDVSAVVFAKGSEVHVSQLTSVFSSFHGPFEIINLAYPDSLKTLRSKLSEFRDPQK